MDEIEVLEVLHRRVLGAGPQVGGGRFIKTSISPQVEHYYKGGDLCGCTIVFETVSMASGGWMFGASLIKCCWKQNQSQKIQVITGLFDIRASTNMYDS